MIETNRFFLPITMKIQNNKRQTKWSLWVSGLVGGSRPLWVSSLWVSGLVGVERVERGLSGLFLSDPLRPT